jgi:hypothetical protein
VSEYACFIKDLIDAARVCHVSPSVSLPNVVSDINFKRRCKVGPWTVRLPPSSSFKFPRLINCRPTLIGIERAPLRAKARKRSIGYYIWFVLSLSFFYHSLCFEGGILTECVCFCKVMVGGGPTGIELRFVKTRP